MRYLIAFLLLFCFSTSIGQSSIDEKNGFKEFKFGSNPTMFKGKITKVGSSFIIEGGTRYVVSSKEYNTVFSRTVKEIELEFDKSNRLWAITIDFQVPNFEYEFDFLKNKLIQNFGEPTGPLKANDSKYIHIQKGYTWIGGKTRIDFNLVTDKTTNVTYISIWYKSSNIEEQISQSEF
jgi:hypothetical protein